MSKIATSNAGLLDSGASLLDLTSLGPGPVNATLYETIRRIAGHMRTRTPGELRTLQEQGPPGLLDDARAWRVETEPEAVLLVAAAERMQRILDGAFRAKPGPSAPVHAGPLPGAEGDRGEAVEP